MRARGGWESPGWAGGPAAVAFDARARWSEATTFKRRFGFPGFVVARAGAADDVQPRRFQGRPHGRARKRDRNHVNSRRMTANHGAGRTSGRRRNRTRRWESPDP